MKVALLTLCFALGVLAQDMYENANDNFDISEVLGNERLLNSYAKCLLNKGPCTPEVKQVKGKFNTNILRKNLTFILKLRYIHIHQQSS